MDNPSKIKTFFGINPGPNSIPPFCPPTRWIKFEKAFLEGLDGSPGTGRRSEPTSEPRCEKDKPVGTRDPDKFLREERDKGLREIFR